MEHAILNETIDGQKVDFYPETGFEDVVDLDNNNKTLKTVVGELQDALTDHNESSTAHADIRTAIATAETNAKEYTDTEKAKYLPLAGGKLTGRFVTRDVDDSMLSLVGGSGEGYGAGLNLRGASARGEFNLYAMGPEGGSGAQLKGTPDGSLTWNGKNVTLQGDCLPLSGGQLTGEYIYRSVDNSILRLCGGSTIGTGARLDLVGSDYSDDTIKGVFGIHAIKGTDDCGLVGLSNGTLTWGGNEVERVVASGDGYIRYASGLQMCWGSGNNISNISTGKNRFTYPAAFISDPSVSIFSIFSSADVFFYKTSLAFVGTSNFMFYAFGYDDNLTGDMFAVSWIAIGRWK